MQKLPGINVDILVLKGSKLLLGLMTEQWSYEGGQVYGVPGRDIYFGEAFGETIKRNIKEEFDCGVTAYEIICINANYALDGHYIGIGATAKIDGEPKVLLPDDWVKWEWFDKDKLPDNLFPATKNLIQCYLEGKVNIAE
jgi:8-oxo-dGTP diphosphatase